MKSPVAQAPWWPVWLAIAACVRAPPPPPPPAVVTPPPAVRVPQGCLDDLSGVFLHPREPRYRYEASDAPDAGLLVIRALVEPIVDAGRPVRRFSRDGGLPWLLRADAGPPAAPPLDAGAVLLATLSLRRTPDGFVGVTLPDGADGGCTFPVRLSACAPGGVVLETPALTLECAISDAGWTSHRLVREGFDAGAPPADAGFDTPRHEPGMDAGTGTDGGATPPPSP